LLRFGWVSWYRQADKETRLRLAAAPTPSDASDDEGAFFPTPGLSPEERTAEWLWDHRIAAVAGDVPSLEAMPFNRSRPETFLHYRIIALLGMAVGEMFDLDALATDCEADGTYEGMFTAAPLNKVGGSGSTANALAIK
jgi:kynurenine formamidase